MEIVAEERKQPLDEVGIVRVAQQCWPTVGASHPGCSLEPPSSPQHQGPAETNEEGESHINVLNDQAAIVHCVRYVQKKSRQQRRRLRCAARLFTTCVPKHTLPDAGSADLYLDLRVQIALYTSIMAV